MNDHDFITNNVWYEENPLNKQKINAYNGRVSFYERYKKISYFIKEIKTIFKNNNKNWKRKGVKNMKIGASELVKRIKEY